MAYETWSGGRVRYDKRGRAVYVIRRMVNGKQYEVSTRCHKESSALEHLRRFEADAEGYDPRGVVRGEPIHLDDKLTKELLAFSKAKGNSVSWRWSQRYHLAWWSKKLHGVDLRRANLRDHILPPLAGGKSRQQRIAVVKGLYSWLRAEVHRITTAEDPCYGQLKVPQSKPEQWTRPKIVSPEVFEAVRTKLDEEFIKRGRKGRRWADLLTVCGGTGMHVEELVRFCGSGAVEPPPKNVTDCAAVVVVPLTKAGDTLRIRVSGEVRDAAERARAGGSFSRAEFDRAMRDACRALKKKKVIDAAFTAAMLRHTVATRAVEAGADLQAVATFLNHRSPRTTRRFYATLASPARVPGTLA